MSNAAMTRLASRLVNLNRSAHLMTIESANYLIDQYYLILFGLSGLPFIVIDRHTDPMLRTIAIMATCGAFLFAIVNFFLISAVNFTTRRLTPVLVECQVRMPLSASVRLKVAELRSQFESNRVGIGCGDIFMFTFTKVCRMVGTMVLNFFLTVNLFNSYFFSTK